MQERLHLLHHPGTDPLPFVSTILAIRDNNLILNSSHCYPRGGGQPGDKGQIIVEGGPTKFGEVTAKEYINHPVSTSDLFEVGQEIQCIIDSKWRNALAKTHTLQHIVSAMADELWDASTVGNQLGTEESRIDIKFEDKTKFDVNTIQDLVNETVLSSVPVTTALWSADVIMTDDRVRNRSFVGRILEKLPDQRKEMRIVNIEGIDICPCAGTHVENTNILPQIEISRIKQKGAGKLRLYYTMKNY